MNSILNREIEENAGINGLFAIAYALLEVANSGHDIANQLDRLGMNGVSGPYGAIEGHSVVIRDSLGDFTSALNELGSSLDNIAAAIEDKNHA